MQRLQMNPPWQCGLISLINSYSIWCFIMTSRVSLKMTSLSPQLKRSMCMDCTLTAPGGIAEAAHSKGSLHSHASHSHLRSNTTASRDARVYQYPIYKKPRRTGLTYVASVNLKTNQNPDHWILRGQCTVTLSKFLHITQALSKKNVISGNCCKHE